jgi:hypothetical protein
MPDRNEQNLAKQVRLAVFLPIFPALFPVFGPAESGSRSPAIGGLSKLHCVRSGYRPRNRSRIRAGLKKKIILLQSHSIKNYCYNPVSRPPKFFNPMAI